MTGKVEVIIDLNLPTASTLAVQSQDVFIQDVQLMGGIVTDRMFTLDNSLLTTIDASKLDELAASPTVKKIIPNQDVFFAPQNIDREPVMLLDTSYTLLDAHKLWKQGLTGKGVVVAVVDTGINLKLSIFQRNGQSIIIDSLQLYGEYVMWHGTAVASCIASQNQIRKGIAISDVSLLNVEVFRPDGAADIWSIKRGWDWVAQWKLTYRDTPVICCNSLGANPYLAPAAIILNDYANKLVTNYNIPMIVAAGKTDMQQIH